MKLMRSYWWLMLILVSISMGGFIACQEDDGSPASPAMTPTPTPTTTPIPVACTGISYDGVCWQITAQNQSCDSLCADFGGIDTSALFFWAGRTPDECHMLTTSFNANVFNGIGNGVDPGFNENNCWNYGCIAEVGVRNRSYLCYQMPQNTSWSDEGSRVICPCNY
jgi:hypothetical protein